MTAQHCLERRLRRKAYLYRLPAGATVAATAIVLIVALSLCPAVRAGDQCARTHPLVGATGDLRMLGRQVRGTVAITSDCAFLVHRLELLRPGTSPDGAREGGTVWRASRSYVLEEAIADATPITAVAPDSAASLGGGSDVAFVLLLGISWDSVGTLLLWEQPGSGAVGLGRPLAAVLLQKLAPGAAEVRVPQPTMLDNCLQLGPSARLRWTLDAAAGAVEIGLEGVLPAGGYLAFGPSPSGSIIVNRPMVGSDVTFVGRWVTRVRGKGVRSPIHGMDLQAITDPC